MRGFNVVVLGAGGVGKSALIARFINNEFIEHYDPTIEEEYRRTISVNGIDTHLEVIDTSGADQFATINEGYIKVGPVNALGARCLSEPSISPDMAFCWSSV